MKVQRSLELRGLIKQTIKLFFEKVVKKVFKGWVQSHCVLLVTLLQLVSVSGVVQNFETYIYSAARRHSSFMM